MKLVEILARELEKWPDAETVFIVQDDDGGIKTSRSNDTPTVTSCGVLQRHGGGNDPYLKIKAMIASDHATSIVTREMWQAEREKIEAYRFGLKQNIKPKKANAEGWIRHRGGKCPVEKGERVDVRYRGGQVNNHVKALVSHDGGGSISRLMAFTWDHNKSEYDIMAYRIHRPAEQPAPEIKVTHIDQEAGVIHAESVSSCGPITLDWQEVHPITAATKREHAVDGCDLDLSQQSAPIVINLRDPHPENPIIWRDRIREIDRTVEALEEERVSLIQRLEGEGLQLLQGKVCGSGQDDNCLPHGISWTDAPVWANVLLDAGSGYSSRYSWAESYSSGARRKFCEGGKLEIEIADHTIFRVISLRPSA